MNKLLLTFVLALNVTQTKALTSPKDSLQKVTQTLNLSIGLGQTAVQFQTISPLIYKGVGFPFAVSYKQETAKSKEYFQVLMLSQSLKSPFKNILTNFELQTLYGYLYQIKAMKNGQFLLGGEFQFRANFQSIPTFINVSYPLFLNGLNLTGQWEHRFKNHRIEAQISTVTIGFNRRPDKNFDVRATNNFFIKEYSLGKLETIFNNLNCTLRLSYSPIPKLKHISWQIDYRGNVYTSKRPQFLGIIQNYVAYSLNFHF
jgi:hypothetical protein